MHGRETTTWNNAITGNRNSFISLKKYLKIFGGNIKKNENDGIFYNITIYYRLHYVIKIIILWSYNNIRIVYYTIIKI